MILKCFNQGPPLLILIKAGKYGIINSKIIGGSLIDKLRVTSICETTNLEDRPLIIGNLGTKPLNTQNLSPHPSLHINRLTSIPPRRKSFPSPRSASSQLSPKLAQRS